MSKPPAAAERVWLITGCSSGLGAALARALLREGRKVIATARDPASLHPLAAAHPENCLALPLDVTDPAQVTVAVSRAEQRFGRIDVLVNNAGYMYMAGIEEGDAEEIRAMFDVNLFGLVAMTQAVLPGMRERGFGLIVNLSSIGGVVASAGTGYYCASKFAVEGLSESLAREAASLGIRVMLVEPGQHRTGIGSRRRWAAHPIAAYDATVRARWAELKDIDTAASGNPAAAAAAIVRAADDALPPFRLLLGRTAYRLAMEKLDTQRQAYAAWREVSEGSDSWS